MKKRIIVSVIVLSTLSFFVVRLMLHEEVSTFEADTKEVIRVFNENSNFDIMLGEEIDIATIEGYVVIDKGSYYELYEGNPNDGFADYFYNNSYLQRTESTKYTLRKNELLGDAELYSTCMITYDPDIEVFGFSVGGYYKNEHNDYYDLDDLYHVYFMHDYILNISTSEMMAFKHDGIWVAYNFKDYGIEYISVCVDNITKQEVEDEIFGLR